MSELFPPESENIAEAALDSDSLRAQFRRIIDDYLAGK